MLFEECFGDRIQCQLLVIAYYQATKKQKQSETKALSDALEIMQPVQLDGDDFRSLLSEIDNTFKNAIHETYLFPQCITKPLLTREQVLNMVNIYKAKLPQHHKLMNAILGFNTKENLLANLHLKDSQYYDRLIFYQFL